MATGPISNCSRIGRRRWFMAVFSVTLGLIVLAAMWVGGQLVSGLWALGVMSAMGAVFGLGGRSETIRGLRGDGRDERFALIDLKATATAGTAVLLAVVVAFVVEVAEGHSGDPYTWLGAIGGLAYAIAIGVLCWRS